MKGLLVSIVYVKDKVVIVGWSRFKVNAGKCVQIMIYTPQDIEVRYVHVLENSNFQYFIQILTSFLLSHSCCKCSNIVTLSFCYTEIDYKTKRSEMLLYQKTRQEEIKQILPQNLKQRTHLSKETQIRSCQRRTRMRQMKSGQRQWWHCLMAISRKLSIVSQKLSSLIQVCFRLRCGCWVSWLWYIFIEHVEIEWS